MYRSRGIVRSVGEHSYWVEGYKTIIAGRIGKANVGISNDKEG